MTETVRIAFNNDWSLEQLKDKVVETPGLRLSGQRKWPDNSTKSTEGESK